MKTLSTQRRMAASVLGVGANKVWFDPLRITEIKEAITKADIGTLIKEGAIKKRPKIGFKRRAGRFRQQRKRKGRGRGFGKKRLILKNKKRLHAVKIRDLRKQIRALRGKGEINRKQEDKLRRLAKASVVKNQKDLMERINQFKQK